MKKRTSIKSIIISVKTMYGESSDLMLEQNARIFCNNHLIDQIYPLVGETYQNVNDNFLDGQENFWGALKFNDIKNDHILYLDYPLVTLSCGKKLKLLDIEVDNFGGLYIPKQNETIVLLYTDERYRNPIDPFIPKVAENALYNYLVYCTMQYNMLMQKSVVKPTELRIIQAETDKAFRRYDMALKKLRSSLSDDIDRYYYEIR